MDVGEVDPGPAPAEADRLPIAELAWGFVELEPQLTEPDGVLLPSPDNVL